MSYAVFRYHGVWFWLVMRNEAGVALGRAATQRAAQDAAERFLEDA